jgi:hypothetical protein
MTTRRADSAKASPIKPANVASNSTDVGLGDSTVWVSVSVAYFWASTAALVHGSSFLEPSALGRIFFMSQHLTTAPAYIPVGLIAMRRPIKAFQNSGLPLFDQKLRDTPSLNVELRRASPMGTTSVMLGVALVTYRYQRPDKNY